MIKNLIFDYGGVIFDIEHDLMAEAFGRLGVPDMKAKVSLAAQSRLFDDLDTGTLTPEGFREAVREMAGELPGGRRLSDQEIDDAWNAMLIGIPRGNLELLERAGKRYRIFLLSNSNVIHYLWIEKYLQREYGMDSVASYFEKAYYSQELGMRKPNSDIFEYVLKTNGLEAEETLFMDDSPQNIKAAGKLGIQTRLVRKGEPLKDVLKGLI